MDHGRARETNGGLCTGRATRGRLEPTQQQQKSWTARRRTRLDVGYDLDTRSVEKRDHTLEIRISGFVHVEYIAIAVVADRVA